MVFMSGKDETSQTGGDPNQQAVVIPTPAGTPGTDPTRTPTATPTAAVVATPSPAPTPTPIPTPTPDAVAERLGRFRSQLAESTEPEVLVGIWSAAVKMLAEAPAARQEEIRTLADGVATKLTRNPRMIQVEEGRFTMGRDGEGSSQDERPAHLVMLSPFQIGQYEVTAIEFATFLNDNKDRAALIFRPTAQTTVQFIEAEDRYAPRPDKEFHAANGISWTAANEYARWLARVTGRDFRLPTEAEWERAARGTERGIYPWGSSDPDVTKAAYGNGTGPVRVDSHPAYRSPAGAFNMAGNVAEWVADWYLDTAYETGALRSNPRGPDEAPSGISPRRVIRGGGFLSRPDELASTRRQRDQPDRADALYGFRLALTP
jgi:formylglycine-generating enzyme required for sulfatase activity